MFCATTLADVVCALFGAGAVPLRTGTGRSGLHVHTTRDVNDPRGLQFLRNLEPDLLVSAFFDQKLKEPVLILPGHGCLNIHPSLLPAFGGVDPVLQARLQKAPVLGVTVHIMTPVLDAGSILAQGPVDVPSGASVFDATARLFDAGAMLLTQHLNLERGGDSGVAQAPDGSYHGWPMSHEVRTLRASGTVLMRLRDLWSLMRSARGGLDATDSQT
jgi:methionyl-tRNA formyltransferase